MKFLPIHSGYQVRWTYQLGSHRRKVTQDFSSIFFLRCTYLVSWYLKMVYCVPGTVLLVPTLKNSKRSRISFIVYLWYLIKIFQSYLTFLPGDFNPVRLIVFTPNKRRNHRFFSKSDELFYTTEVSPTTTVTVLKDKMFRLVLSNNNVVNFEARSL